MNTVSTASGNSINLHDLYLHPLRHVPGPKWAAFSDLRYAVNLLRGRAVTDILQLHQKYGPVVRVAPDEVSFTTADSLKSIYGFKPGQKDGYKKDMHCFPLPLNGTRGITPAYGPDHANLLVERLRNHVESGSDGLIDAVAWYNFITFDIISDLSFGDSFHCLENSDYHPLVQMIYATLKSATLMDFVIAKVNSRLSMETSRADFLTPVSNTNDSKALTRKEIETKSLVFLIAGSETTATTLSAATYLSLTHPEVWGQLKREVRGAFGNGDEIVIDAINSKLPYMLAMLNETLRFYPPVPTGFGRVVPRGGDTISGYFIPEGTGFYAPQYAINHLSEYFTDHDAFRPERWLGDPKYETDNHTVFNLFSLGPRNCLGKNLAYLEMRMIMAKMIWNFDMELCENSQEGWMQHQKVYTLCDKPPLMIKFSLAQRQE
ncbi:cytochrome P450 [Zopfia rhizophila CBS 207.26]|uniref:Cytochrome P450 n=1 Tax=Zopfia rhizophila CBS 207.26 TaxID=1314779 RepID=A0A6A6ECQ1_9PEZI|nr:cytochrome P450 [Zopfia rhizophila CBS 207.26]